jgi:hypothetical protein
VSVTTAGLADSATATAASEEEMLTGVVVVPVAAPVVGEVLGRSVMPRPVRRPTVPTDPTTADSSETARTPASHRSRNGREEVVLVPGVSMDLPALVADGSGPTGEDRRTGVRGTKVASGTWSLLSMTAIPAPTPENVLRIEGIGAASAHTR